MKKVLWFTGLSGAGKTTRAYQLHKKLKNSIIIDSDNLQIFKKGPFTEKDRLETQKKIINIIKYYLKKKEICYVIVSFITPFKKDREKLKRIFKEKFVEIYINTPLDVCIKRDPKGLYKQALCGKIKNFPGIEVPYEKPDNPDIAIDTLEVLPEEAAKMIINFLEGEK